MFKVNFYRQNSYNRHTTHLLRLYNYYTEEVHTPPGGVDRPYCDIEKTKEYKTRGS